MQGTIHTEDLGTDLYQAVTGVRRRDLVEPEVASPPPGAAPRDADTVSTLDGEEVLVETEPGTVMLPAADRHRQLEVVARRLVAAANARRARLN